MVCILPFSASRATLLKIDIIIKIMKYKVLVKVCTLQSVLLNIFILMSPHSVVTHIEHVPPDQVLGSPPMQDASVQTYTSGLSNSLIKNNTKSLFTLVHINVEIFEFFRDQSFFIGSSF